MAPQVAKTIVHSDKGLQYSCERNPKQTKKLIILF